MKTHKITRKNLIELRRLFSSCSKWKEKITDCLIENIGTSVTIDDKILQEAYNEANTQQKTIIEKYFKIEKSVDIFSKYNTLDKIKKYYKDWLLPFKSPKNAEERSDNAKYILRRIIKLYNQNHIFQWNNHNQYKYFIFWSFPNGGGSGFAFCDHWRAGAYGPLDLAIKDRPTAEKIITNFPEVIKDYFMIEIK